MSAVFQMRKDQKSKARDMIVPMARPLPLLSFIKSSPNANKNYRLIFLSTPGLWQKFGKM